MLPLEGGQGGLSEFVSSVNPITTRGADFVHHITASPPGFENPAASLNMMAGRPISHSLNRPTASLGGLISSSKCVQCKEGKKLLQSLCLACFQKNELRRSFGI